MSILIVTHLHIDVKITAQRIGLTWHFTYKTNKYMNKPENGKNIGDWEPLERT